MSQKSMGPTVSVLIPNYNYGQFLGEAIESVLAQTYQDFEILVVDNCSTDNSKEVVETYMKEDKRIRFLQNPTNLGMYRNYNQCLLNAQGKYIKFLNSDDKFAPTLLEKMVAILDSMEDISLVTSYRQYFGKENKVLKPDRTGRIPRKEAILKGLLEGNYIGEPTAVMFRRKNLNLGLFDISILNFADLDMWLRQLQVGDLYVIDEVLSYFRIHDRQATVFLFQDLDQHIFNRLQWYAYHQYALLINRFGIDFSLENPKEVKKIIKRGQRRMYKYLFAPTIHRTKVRSFVTSFFLFKHIKYLFKKWWPK